MYKARLELEQFFPPKQHNLPGSRLVVFDPSIYALVLRAIESDCACMKYGPPRSSKLREQKVSATHNMNSATQIINDSAFGCAGQRCLAVSVAVTVGEAQKTFRNAIADAAASLRVGNGLKDGVQMGPVITAQSRSRIQSLISAGEKDGAKVLIDGRNPKIPEHAV